MRSIPTEHRKEFAKNDYFWKCMLCGAKDVQIHHVFQYGGRQISELWNYLPLCTQHHAEVTPHNIKFNPQQKNYTEWFTLMKMTDEDRQKYPRFDWLQKKKFLDSIFL